MRDVCHCRIIRVKKRGMTGKKMLSCPSSRQFCMSQSQESSSRWKHLLVITKIKPNSFGTAQKIRAFTTSSYITPNSFSTSTQSSKILLLGFCAFSNIISTRFSSATSMNLSMSTPLSSKNNAGFSSRRTPTP